MDRLRIVMALVGKDIVDGLKSRFILNTIVGVSVLMVMYRALPVLGSSGDDAQLALYDAGSSGLVTELRESGGIELVVARSQEELEAYLGSSGAAVLGLVLPADFDQAVQEAGTVQMEGHLDHWVGDRAAAEIEATFEARLGELIEKPVDLTVQRGTVYTRPTGFQAFTNSLSLLVLLAMLGVMVTAGLMLEEKEKRTINALLVSPASPGQVVLGKAITGLVLCLVAAAAWAAFSLAWIVHWVPLLLGAVLGALFTVSVGLVTGTLCHQRQQLSLWGLVLMQPLLLGPAFGQLGFVPERIRQVLSWIPTTALIKVLSATFGASAPLAEYAPQLALLTAYTALVLTVAVWLMRRSDR
jgi:ABC-2 type transport system permease protein